MADYTTRTKVKTALGINDTAKDSLIDQYIPYTTTAINSFCDTNFNSTEYTEYPDGTGLDYFFTEYSPIISVSSLIDDYDHNTSNGTTTIASNQYIIYAKLGKIQLDPQGHAPISAFTTVKQGIKIVYTAGYATIPADIEFAATELVALWSGLKTKTYLTDEGIVAAVSITPGRLPVEITKLLAPYRRIRMV